jgi:hypothetical protein
MVQPALKPFQMTDVPKSPRSLAERLETEVVREGLAEPTVSSMAERFAPDTLRIANGESRRPLLGETRAPSAFTDAGRLAMEKRGIFAVLTAVALAPAGILVGLLWLGAIRGPEATLDLADDAQVDKAQAPTSQQAAVAATPLLNAKRAAPEIALTVPETIDAKPGEDIGFAIAIDSAEALPGRSVIAIRDLPKGAAFSQGRPYGTSEWSLRPDEIAGLTLRLPDDHSGAAKLRVELASADGTVLARAATTIDTAPNPGATLVVRAGEADRVDTLIAHGNDMIAVGYLAGARAYFERAAEAGSGEAALAVGATYDPEFIAEIGAHGIKADPAAAKTWYDRAATLGVTDQQAKLAGLRGDWVQHDEAPAEVAAAAPEEAVPAPVEGPRTVAAEPEAGPLGRLVAAATTLANKNQWVEVSSSVNLREEASGTAKTLKVVPKGSKFRVQGREGNWVQVANPATSEEGWIYTQFLKETEAP